MFSFPAPYWRRRVAMIKPYYHGEKRPRKGSSLLRMLKSCFGHGSVEVDLPSRSEYQRAGDPSSGFRGEEVYGIQAEYLDEDDRAWGKPRQSKKRARPNDRPY